jgi:hypothetical protein
MKCAAPWKSTRRISAAKRGKRDAQELRGRGE